MNVMNASELSVCGIVQLTDPLLLVKTGLMYMLSVYHSGSVACHPPASPARIHHLLSIKISRVRINLSHRRTRVHKYTPRLLDRQSEQEGKKMIEKEENE